MPESRALGIPGAPCDGGAPEPSASEPLSPAALRIFRWAHRPKRYTEPPGPCFYLTLAEGCMILPGNRCKALRGLHQCPKGRSYH